jgi:hypothetical protein
MQRPVNELKQVKEGLLFKWAALDSPAFAARLTAVFLAVFVFIGGPIAYQTFDPGAQLQEFVLAGTLGSLLVTTVVTMRIYLGWAYVRQRLLSASIEYEVCAPPLLLSRAACVPLPFHAQLLSCHAWSLNTLRRLQRSVSSCKLLCQLAYCDHNHPV